MNDEIIEFIISDFNCNGEYIYDEFYEYLKNTFATKYPEKTKSLYKHYFPKKKSINIDDLYEEIKEIVIEEIFQRNENIERYF